jgi:flagellar hook-length control protein FliK
VELVKYKMVISKLMKELSGEIKALNDSSGKPITGFNPANLKENNLLKIAEVIADRAQILPSDNIGDFSREVINQNTKDSGKVTEPVVLEQRGFPESSTKEKINFSGKENREKGLLQVDFPDGAAKNQDKIPTDNPQDKFIPGFLALQDKVENVSSVPSRTAPLWEQIAASIQRYAINQPGEIREFELQLHPRELGKIRVNLQWENGLVHINCQASEALTAGILQQNLVQLRETLENNGITCGMMQMGPGGQQKQDKPNDEAKPYMKTSASEAEEINSLARAVSYSASKLSDVHLINLTA